MILGYKHINILYLQNVSQLYFISEANTTHATFEDKLQGRQRHSPDWRTKSEESGGAKIIVAITIELLQCDVTAPLFRAMRKAETVDRRI
jgi:hypothetical protein